MVAAKRPPTWESFFDRCYPGLLLSLWVLFPELRRVIDWQVGFNSFSVVNVIPLAALVPLVPRFFRLNRPGISYGFKLVAGLWVIGFLYALMVGYLSGRLFGAVYECGIFLLPLLVGAWLVTLDPTVARRVFERFVTATLWLAAFVSAYGIYQYISPPAWDIYWMLNSGLASIGNPVPFEVRVFSSLNSPLTCADFLAVALLLMLYRLNIRRFWLVGLLMLLIACLLLTLVRTAWLEIGLGVISFIVLSPRRGFVALTAALAIIITGIVAADLSVLTGNKQVANQIQERLHSFDDLQDDASADSRVNGSATTIHQSYEEPLGQGLGFAAGAKLSGGSTASAASTYGADNGYAERLLEMGFFGFALYLIAIAVAFGTSVVALRRCVIAGDVRLASLIATLLAVQIALIGGDISADHHSSLMAIFFWMSVGLTAATASLVPKRTPSTLMSGIPRLAQPAHGRS